MAIDSMSCKLLYDKYLHSLAAEIDVRKKVSQRVQQITCELAGVALEQDQLRKESINLKLDENQLTNVIEIQKELDDEWNKWMEYKKIVDLETAIKIMSNLYSLLRPFDMLRCENIEPPRTAEEWQILVSDVRKLLNVLKLNKKVIKQKSEGFEKTANRVKEFNELEKKLQIVHEKFLDNLYKLQQVVLYNSAKVLDSKDKEES